MKTLGGVFAFLMLLVLGGVIALFSAHVILSLAGLYSVPFVENLTLSQAFGFLYICAVIRLKVTDNKSKSKFDNIGEALVIAFAKIIEVVIGILGLWGLGFLFHWMFF